MPESLEQRVEKLERQMAALLAEKNHEKIGKILQKSEDVSDALFVFKGDDGISPGLYCRHCWNNHGALTPLDVDQANIPRASDGRRYYHQCPSCHENLELVFVGRM